MALNKAKVVKMYYDKGLYTIDDVSKFVVSKAITEQDFEDITSMSYTDYLASKEESLEVAPSK